MIKSKQAYFEGQGIGNYNTMYIVPFVSIREVKLQLNYLRIVIYLIYKLPISTSFFANTRNSGSNLQNVRTI